MKNKKAILVIIALLILIPLAIYVYGRVSKLFCTKLEEDTALMNQNSNNVNIPKQATDFTLNDLNGNKVSLSNLKGKKVFLNFWATWCPPCNEEMPFLSEIYKENHNIEIITITTNEDKKTVEKYIKSNHYEFTVLLDTNGKIANSYQAYSIPMSILIDENGNIIDKHKGMMNKGELIDFMKLNSNKKIAYTNITDDEAKIELEKDSSIILLDVRTKEEYDEKHITNSVLIPLDELEKRASSELTNKQAKIFVYCRSGKRSVTASEALVNLGYTNVYNLGGIIDWKYETE